MLRLFCLFALVSFTLSCSILQTCDCDFESDSKRGPCDTMECCEIDNVGGRNVGAVPPLRTLTFDDTTVATRCMCCSCANVTCTNSFHLQFEGDFESDLQDRTGSSKPSISFNNQREETTSKQKPQGKTLADKHRELYHDPVEVRGCYDVTQECNCNGVEGCSEVHCCDVDNFLESDFFGENRQMIIRGDGVTRGDLLISCDCCSCSSVDCTDVVNADIEVEIDLFGVPG